MSQAFTDTILMIRPKAFGYNTQTAKTNSFQRPILDDENLLTQVQGEFDKMVDQLREKGVEVMVVEDTAEPAKPDAIFSNNWLTTHDDGKLITYPMFAPNRRSEVRRDILEQLKEKYGFTSDVDFTHYANARIFLEGTGSMVLDREAKMCYACLSPRTDERLLNEFCQLMKYEPMVFDALDHTGNDVYHTNVMMAIGKGYAVLCMECIEEQDERRALIRKIAESGKEIIPITASQMAAFAGNILHLQSKDGKDLILLSKRAHKILIDSQLEKLKKYGELVVVDIEHIEKVGGGGVRCMMTEILAPK